ncbi:MAG: hypothetical protein QMC80_00380 [Thermoplasmatales archaeon]|nr:hypothetical protein [Thermoplasmatales archaeon]
MNGEKMKRAVLILMFFGIMLVSTVFISGHGGAEAEVPAFQTGDRWEYSMSGNSMGTEMSGTMVMKVTGTGIISVNGTDYDVWIMKTSGEISFTGYMGSGTSTTNGTAYIQKTDLATVKTITDTEMTGTSSWGNTHSSEHIETTYDPPKDDFDFPVKVGETWMVVTNETTYMSSTHDGETWEENYTDTITTNYKCISMETIHVPAGTFETYKIRSSEEDSEYYDIMYYSVDIGLFVKMENYDETDEIVATAELTYYQYGAVVGGEEGIGEEEEVVEEEGGEKEFLEKNLVYMSFLIGILIGVVIALPIGLIRGRAHKGVIYPQPLSPQEQMLLTSSFTMPSAVTAVQCYACGQVMHVTSPERPLVIICVTCGAKGVLK